MALVKITNQLLDRVRANIGGITHTYLSKEGLIDNNLAVSQKTAEQLIWGEHYHLRPLVPADWLHWCIPKQKKSATYKPSDIQLGDVYATISCDADGFFLPPNNSVYHSTTLTDSSLHRITDAEERQKAVSFCLGLVRSIEINREWESVWEGVKALLLASKSLNDAVKQVPSIITYLDPTDIERLDRKVERTARKPKPSPEELGVDVESITAAAVAYKMGV